MELYNIESTSQKSYSYIQRNMIQVIAQKFNMEPDGKAIN